MNNKKQYEEYQPILKKIEKILAKFIRYPTDMDINTSNENNGNLLELAYSSNHSTISPSGNGFNALDTSLENFTYPLKS